MKKYLALLALSISLSGCWTTAEGNKVGVVTKLAKQGVIIGTWEGQMVRGGLNSGSGTIGQAFDFTVEKNDVLQTLQKAMDEGKEVKIFYHKEAVTFLRSESNDYFVDRVEFVNNK